jgi:hypothetical protein
MADEATQVWRGHSRGLGRSKAGILTLLTVATVLQRSTFNEVEVAQCKLAEQVGWVAKSVPLLFNPAHNTEILRSWPHAAWWMMRQNVLILEYNSNSDTQIHL